MEVVILLLLFTFLLVGSYHMSAALTNLTNQVKASIAIEAKALAAIRALIGQVKSLTDQLAASKDDPAAMAELAGQLQASAAELEAALPVEPAPEQPPA